MGGGNGCKSAAKREKNMAKMQKQKKTGSQSAAIKSQPFYVCKKCFTQFPTTAREPELRNHVDNKHPDFGFESSFPTFGQEQKSN